MSRGHFPTPEHLRALRGPKVTKIYSINKNSSVDNRASLANNLRILADQLEDGTICPEARRMAVVIDNGGSPQVFFEEMLGQRRDRFWWKGFLFTAAAETLVDQNEEG